MRTRSFLSALAALAAALLILAALPAGSSAAPALAATPMAQAAWSPAATLPVLPPAAAPPALIGTVGISVMPHTDQFCSIETQGVPDSCSVEPGVAARFCSAHCDSSQNCSVDGRSAAPSPASCSTYARPRVACSALNPPVGVPGTFGSICSIYDADTVQDLECSTMEPGVLKQFCSAENPGGPGNFCSTRESSNNGTQCSVLQSAPGARNFCSVAFVGQKLCSAGEDGRCSITSGLNGSCSTFRQATPGLCSAFGPNAHCSVIGGAAGTQCRQP